MSDNMTSLAISNSVYKNSGKGKSKHGSASIVTTHTVPITYAYVLNQIGRMCFSWTTAKKSACI